MTGEVVAGNGGGEETYGRVGRISGSVKLAILFDFLGGGGDEFFLIHFGKLFDVQVIVCWGRGETLCILFLGFLVRSL